MYDGGDYDLAGFAVGAVSRPQLIDGSGVTEGDRVLGLASSGPHSNGYSLIRAVRKRAGAALDAPIGAATGDATLGDALLAPTRIYVRALLALFERSRPRALAHITGGGLTENLPRVLPDGLGVALDAASWPRPPVFDWLQRHGDIDDAEMRRTFNCGIGMAVVVGADALETTRGALEDAGEAVYDIGRIVATPGVHFE